MKLYKFKPLDDSTSSLQVYDILANNHLHCTSVKNFNDPFEGYCFIRYLLNTYRNIQVEKGVLVGTVFGDWKDFTYSDSATTEFQELVYSKKVCALSKHLDNILLWAHYANGHFGVAIEIDVPDEEITFNQLNEDDKYRINYKVDTPLHKVEYARTFPDILDGKNSPIRESQVYRALTTKLSNWEYEGEFRIIHDKEYYALSKPIQNVYCGCKVTDVEMLKMRKIRPDINFYRSIPIYNEPWIKF